MATAMQINPPLRAQQVPVRAPVVGRTHGATASQTHASLVSVIHQHSPKVSTRQFSTDVGSSKHLVGPDMFVAMPCTICDAVEYLLKVHCERVSVFPPILNILLHPHTCHR